MTAPSHRDRLAWLVNAATKFILLITPPSPRRTLTQLDHSRLATLFQETKHQSPQPEDHFLYMELPQHYRPAGLESQDVVLKLNKSI